MLEEVAGKQLAGAGTVPVGEASSVVGELWREGGERGEERGARREGGILNQLVPLCCYNCEICSPSPSVKFTLHIA